MKSMDQEQVSRLEKFALYLRIDRGLSLKTVEAYVSDVKPCLFHLEKPLQNVTELDLQELLKSLTKTGNLGNRSLARKLSALRLFFQFAVTEGWCLKDPTLEMRSPKIAASLPTTLSHAEVEALLEAPIQNNCPTDALMLRVLYAAGLRVSELVTLKPESIASNAGVLRVQGKGDKIRVVPIDPNTHALLLHYLSSIRPHQKEGSDTRPLFLSRLGRGFTRQAVWKMIKKYVLKTGLNPSVSPHVLRHAFATHLLERGMSLRSLQMLLGHSDIATTEIYSHVSNTHLHDALRQFHPRSHLPKK